MTEQAANERPAIAAAIIVNDRKVLMVRRRVSEGELSWQFPAGQVEAGETGPEAAARETKEEVGLTVLATKTLGERDHPNTGRHMIYVACDVVDGTAEVVDQDELDAVEWCDRSKLAEHVPYPLFQPVQEYLSVALEEPPYDQAPSGHDPQPLDEDEPGATQ
jgi:8-oxo-dGTP diphosphatase